MNIIKRLKKYHLYECIEKKSNEKAPVLMLSDEKEVVDVIILPNESSENNYEKHSVNIKKFKELFAFKEIVLCNKEKNSYTFKYLDEEKLKVKLNIFSFVSADEMIEYYIEHPNDDYKIDFNKGTNKIIIYKKQCNIENNNDLIDLPILEIDKSNYEILKNFGFFFTIIDKFNISQKEMFLLLAHQFNNYYLEKKDDKVTIFNEESKTEFNGFLSCLPNLKKISIEDLILKCNVVKDN